VRLGKNWPRSENFFYNGKERNARTGVLNGRCVRIFFTTEKNGKKANGKGTEGEKTECKDGSSGWNEDGGITFFVLRATARCTKRVSI